MTGKPGDKGPMGEDAHPDEAAGTPAEGAKPSGGEKELDKELDETFPASDAPSDTQRTRTK